MKKLLSLIVVVLFLGSLFAVESDPSEVVGYVEYDLVTTAGTNLNYIALPLNSGLVLASAVGTDIGVCDAVAYWDAVNQGWVQATDLGFPVGWVGDFAVAPGDALMVGVTAAASYYVAGDLPTPATYTLVTSAGTNLNSIMVPLDQTFALASALGTDIGVCDAVAYWDATNQGWAQASDLGFPVGWVGDFAVAIADPLMVNVTSGTAWPTALLMSSEQTPTKIVNTNIKKNRK
jgi:hypothetical protein